jgi:hypothetical protein
MAMLVALQDWSPGVPGTAVVTSAWIQTFGRILTAKLSATRRQHTAHMRGLTLMGDRLQAHLIRNRSSEQRY